jgi:hypothetical protein
VSQTRRRVGSERKDTGSTTICSMSSGASWTVGISRAGEWRLSGRTSRRFTEAGITGFGALPPFGYHWGNGSNRLTTTRSLQVSTLAVVIESGGPFRLAIERRALAELSP